MDLFIYSDESGVFDKAHNDVFVFGGLVFLSKEDKDRHARLYLRAERTVRDAEQLAPEVEAKATVIAYKSKGKLYRSLRGAHRFGVVVRQALVLDSIFADKKTKQRYLDYAYKIAVKRKFERLIRTRVIKPEDVHSLHFFVDEHTTATNGKYELREALEQEFRFGTYNFHYSKFFPPIFPNLKSVEVAYCNSRVQTLVRAADIVANKLFYYANQDMLMQARYSDSNLNCIELP